MNRYNLLVVLSSFYFWSRFNGYTLFSFTEVNLSVVVLDNIIGQTKKQSVLTIHLTGLYRHPDDHIDLNMKVNFNEAAVKKK